MVSESPCLSCRLRLHGNSYRGAVWETKRLSCFLIVIVAQEINPFHASLKAPLCRAVAGGVATGGLACGSWAAR